MGYRVSYTNQPQVWKSGKRAAEQLGQNPTFLTSISIPEHPVPSDV